MENFVKDTNRLHRCTASGRSRFVGGGAERVQVVYGSNGGRSTCLFRQQCIRHGLHATWQTPAGVSTA